MLHESKSQFFLHSCFLGGGRARSALGVFQEGLEWLDRGEDGWWKALLLGQCTVPRRVAEKGSLLPTFARDFTGDKVEVVVECVLVSFGSSDFSKSRASEREEGLVRPRVTIWVYIDREIDGWMDR
jgi:hypothetical protein